MEINGKLFARCPPWSPVDRTKTASAAAFAQKYLRCHCQNRYLRFCFVRVSLPKGWAELNPASSAFFTRTPVNFRFPQWDPLHPACHLLRPPWRLVRKPKNGRGFVCFKDGCRIIKNAWHTRRRTMSLIQWVAERIVGEQVGGYSNASAWTLNHMETAWCFIDGF